MGGGNVQDFDGITAKQAIIRTGNGPATLEPAGRVYSLYTSAGNVGTAETILGSYTIKANSMPAASGKAVRIRCWGKTAANGNNKTMLIYFGATVVATHGLAATNDKDWYMDATIIQGAAGAQTALGEVFLEGAAAMSIAPTTPAETETGDIIVKCTGESGTATDDILIKGMTVEFLN